MILLLAGGLGLIVSGLYFVVTAQRAAEPSNRRRLVLSLAIISAHVAVGVGLSFLLSGIDSSIVSTLLLLIAGIGIAWSIIRGLRSPSPTRALMVLAGSVLLSTLFMLALGWLLGDATVEAALPAPPEAVADATGDCECDPAFDIRSLGAGADGSLRVLLGAGVPSSAGFLIWSELHPHTPIEMNLRHGVWSVVVPDHLELDPESVVAIDERLGFHLRLGTDIGAIAVTTAQGDRAPDSGYINSDTASVPSERTIRFQTAYTRLNDAQRKYASFLMNQVSQPGSHTYEVGFSAAPDAVQAGSLTIGQGHVEFTVGSVGSPDVHADRYALDGDSRCLGGDEAACESLWTNPFQGVDDLMSSTAEVEAVLVKSREVLDREAACVAITKVGSTVLHLGEFCAFTDGTVAFADDRTAGAVFLLTQDSATSEGGGS